MRSIVLNLNCTDASSCILKYRTESPVWTEGAEGDATGLQNLFLLAFIHRNEAQERISCLILFFYTLNNIIYFIGCYNYVAESKYTEIHFTLVRMAITKKTSNKCWQECAGKGTLTCCWCECKLLQPLWKSVWRVIKKLQIELPSDPAIPLLGIYLKDCKSAYNKDTITPMLLAVLVTIVKLWNQLGVHQLMNR
jgi:hypothetical protein